MMQVGNSIMIKMIFIAKGGWGSGWTDTQMLYGFSYIVQSDL